MKTVTIPHRWRVAPVYTCQVADDDQHPMRTALEHAVLTRAVLNGADLTDADLTRANLTGADLTDADLARANLTGVNLTGANLTGADLAGADLARANLTGVNLTGADLTRAKADFRTVLDAAPAEVDGLLLALREGRINGSAYEGDCACLVGTIANIRGLPGLHPDSARPAERLFLAISPGHVPAINPIARLVESWILEWQAERATGGAK